MDRLSEIFSIASSDFLELLPWFFIAILIGASVDILYLDIVARRSFRKHGLLGILFTTGIGAFSPFCSFTVIPLIRKLLRGGVPLSAVMAFWIASPAMDPPIFALTAAKIGIPLATARLLAALALSIGAGIIILALEKRGMFRDVLRRQDEALLKARELVPTSTAAGPVPALAGASTNILAPGTTLDTKPASGNTCDSTTAETGAGSSRSSSNAPCASDEDADDDTPWWPTAKASLRTPRNWKITGRNICRDSANLGKWLLFACVFEALIRVFVPNSLITNTLGGGRGLLAIPLATLISIPLYLNGVGAIPIVGALLAKGMAEGAAVSFLLGGAVTTIPAMVAVRSVVKNRVFVAYLAFGIVGSILLGFTAQILL